MARERIHPWPTRVGRVYYADLTGRKAKNLSNMAHAYARRTGRRYTTEQRRRNGQLFLRIECVEVGL